MTLRPSARCSVGTSADHRAQVGVRMCRGNAQHRAPPGRGTRWNQSGCKADEYQYSACYQFRGVQTQTFIPESQLLTNFLGGAAIACLVLGCAWTVYANIFRADVYPHLGSANFDAPVIKRPAAVAAQRAAGRRQSVCRSVRTGAADFRARGGSAASVAVVRRPVRSRRPARRRADAAGRSAEARRSTEAASRKRRSSRGSAEAEGSRSRRRSRSPPSPPPRPAEARPAKSPATPSATWRSAPRRR